MKYITIITIVLFCACSKNAGSLSSTHASILDGGQPGTAIGPCGWIISIDSDKQYHPDNLSPEFQKNALEVNVTYQLTKDTFNCGDFILTRLPVIHILTIQKK